MDSCLRRNDAIFVFLRFHQDLFFDRIDRMFRILVQVDSNTTDTYQLRFMPHDFSKPAKESKVVVFPD